MKKSELKTEKKLPKITGQPFFHEFVPESCCMGKITNYYVVTKNGNYCTVLEIRLYGKLYIKNYYNKEIDLTGRICNYVLPHHDPYFLENFGGVLEYGNCVNKTNGNTYCWLKEIGEKQSISSIRMTEIVKDIFSTDTDEDIMAIKRKIYNEAKIYTKWGFFKRLTEEIDKDNMIAVVWEKTETKKSLIFGEVPNASKLAPIWTVKDSIKRNIKFFDLHKLENNMQNDIQVIVDTCEKKNMNENVNENYTSRMHQFEYITNAKPVEHALMYGDYTINIKSNNSCLYDMEFSKKIIPIATVERKANIWELMYNLTKFDIITDDRNINLGKRRLLVELFDAIKTGCRITVVVCTNMHMEDIRAGKVREPDKNFITSEVLFWKYSMAYKEMMTKLPEYDCTKLYVCIKKLEDHGIDIVFCSKKDFPEVAVRILKNQYEEFLSGIKRGV
jgi:hypothetical protein